MSPANIGAVGKAYVVVLNWNHAQDTMACVQSLFSMNYPSFEVVVCDNDSHPDDVQALRTWCATLLGAQEVNSDGNPLAPKTPGIPRVPVTLLHTGANLGYAGGMNKGMAYALARGDMAWAWVLNNDTEVHPDALSELVARASAAPDIGICGSTLVYHGRREMVQALGGASYQPARARSAAIGAFTATQDTPHDPSEVERQMAYVVGASMLVSRRFLEQVGLMDESYFLYSEEHDWAHRGLGQGFKLAWAPRSVVYHKHGATIGTSPAGGSQLSLFYLYRNKAVFTWRHHRPWFPLAIASLAFEAIKFLLKGHPRKALGVLRGLCSFPHLGKYKK